MILATDLTDYAADSIGLVEFAASYLHDRTHRMWSKSELVLYINEAQWALAAEINKIHKEYFLGSSTTPTVADQVYYCMPPDLVALVGLEVLDSSTDRDPSDLVSVHISDRRFYEGLTKASNKDDYRYYFVAGTNFELMPEGGSAGKYIRSHFVKRLTRLVNNGDESVIPLQHHELLAMDAARRALIKTRQDNPQLERMRAERLEQMAAEIRVYTIPREERVEPFYGSYGQFVPVDPRF